MKLPEDIRLDELFVGDILFIEDDRISMPNLHAMMNQYVDEPEHVEVVFVSKLLPGGRGKIVVRMPDGWVPEGPSRVHGNEKARQR